MVPEIHPCPKCGQPFVVDEGVDPAAAACPRCGTADANCIMGGQPAAGADAGFRPSPAAGDAAEFESIFSDEDVDDESVFGPAERKQIVFPTGNPSPTPRPTAATEGTESSEPSSSLTVPVVIGFSGPPPTPPGGINVTVAPASDWGADSGTIPALKSPEPAPPPPANPIPAGRPGSGSGPVPTETPTPRKSPGIATWLLVAYAVVATAAAVLGWARPGPDGHPLSALSDVFGEYEPAGRTSVSGLPGPDADVPDELRVALGKTLTVGDLRVTPKAIAAERVVRVTEFTGNSAPTRQPLPHPCLVLRATVENLSADTTFHPVDPAFHRRPVYGEPAVVGLYPFSGRRFLGGPIEWPFDGPVKRAYIAGQEADDRPLGPGESRDVMIGSLSDPDLVPMIRGAKGPILWKLHLRRGLAAWGFRRVPVTTLVGVEFTADQVDWSAARG